MPAQRRDPADGNSYTYEELSAYYSGYYRQKDIDAYWENECVPKSSPTAKVKVKSAKSPKSNANAEEDNDSPSRALIVKKASNTELMEKEETSQFSQSISRAKAALGELQKSLTTYDEEFKGKASQTATAALKNTIEQARAAIDSVSRKGSILKDQTAEIPVKALSKTLSHAGDAVDKIKVAAETYDETHQLSSSVRVAIEKARESCMTALGESSHHVASVAASANAKLQGVNDGLRARAAAIAGASSSFIFATAVDIDERFNVEAKALAASSQAAEKAKEIEDKYHVVQNASALAQKGLDRAQGLDSRMTGGKVTPVVLSAYETGLAMATQGLSFVVGEFATAKQEKQEKVGGPLIG